MVYQRKGTKRNQVHTFLTDDEKEALVRYAEEQGLSQSAAIRQLIMNASVAVAPVEIAS